MTTCPQCGGDIEERASVCRHCLQILDDDALARHDAGRLGADGRGAGHQPEDPPVGPIPITGSGIAGGVAGVANTGLRLVTTGLLLRRRRRRQSDA
ncbi:MAG: hypothetical protein ACRDNB_01630 [Gaiellaceae bacterium]